MSRGSNKGISTGIQKTLLKTCQTAKKAAADTPFFNISVPKKSTQSPFKVFFTTQLTNNNGGVETETSQDQHVFFFGGGGGYRIPDTSHSTTFFFSTPPCDTEG